MDSIILQKLGDLKAMIDHRKELIYLSEKSKIPDDVVEYRFKIVMLEYNIIKAVDQIISKSGKS